MKKYLLLIFTLLFFNLISTANEITTKTVVTSFYPIYITSINLLKNIDNIKIINLTKPQTGCLHDYQLTPKDVKTIAQSEVLIINGAQMESFLDKVLELYPNLKIIDASRNIELLSSLEKNIKNPHVWVSISLAMAQVKNIAHDLITVFPQDSKQIQKNTNIYLAKLNYLKIKMHKQIDPLLHKEIITFHEAFPYFAKEFNLKIVGIIEREPGSEPSAKELSDLIKIIKKLPVKSLFVEPQYSSKAAETIGRETSSTVYTLDPAVTGQLSPDAYINIMKKNLIVLEKALK